MVLVVMILEEEQVLDEVKVWRAGDTSGFVQVLSKTL